VTRYEQPWLADKRLKRIKRGNLIIGAFIVAGLLLSAYLNFRAYQRVSNHNVSHLITAGIVISDMAKYCLILDEKFVTLNPDIWNHEVQV
jgi:hypothetical protein